ncbi:hypothetical protein [Billgrantia bachuensis]|uniref:Uncharacterized protein n=1 Tax=Billgrantia bachuensis TaxID=2717286 RepID=A0ABX0PST5_9GAMM|nr:hypothetical protein [Halomonas bachuensis]NIC05267.1 hypothetical protein [Halomonas bachuensis]
MEFDVQKFTSAAFSPRTDEVPVEALRPFFKGLSAKQKPKWKVRGLTGAELALCNEAQARNRNRNAIAEGMLSGVDDKVAEAVKALLGADGKVPDELAKRIEMLVIASVEPACTHQVAVKLAEAFPVEFNQLTNEIVKLTGQGGEPGKPKRSSGTKTSSSPSSSAT